MVLVKHRNGLMYSLSPSEVQMYADLNNNSVKIFSHDNEKDTRTDKVSIVMEQLLRTQLDYFVITTHRDLSVSSNFHIQI